MTSAERPPLDRERLQASITDPWARIQVVETTESTNADLLGSAAADPGGSVLVAEYQSAGRGRLDRTWTSPPRAGLTFSVLLRPDQPAPRWSWLPLLTGLALREAVADVTALDAVLKWPNDLLVGPRRLKAAGVLVQLADAVAVIGVGLNVTTTVDELPVDTATSLAIEGASPDRTALLVAILDRLGRRYRRWEGGGEIAADYRDACATIGAEVIVSPTDGTPFRATATDVDADGRLVVVSDGEQRVVAAGDVRHVRPA
jgi:BirA family biotin operon repressor/biotin-[acetyl-CoA-carboxylase] ligase